VADWYVEPGETASTVGPVDPDGGTDHGSGQQPLSDATPPDGIPPVPPPDATPPDGMSPVAIPAAPSGRGPLGADEMASRWSEAERPDAGAPVTGPSDTNRSDAAWSDAGWADADRHGPAEIAGMDDGIAGNVGLVSVADGRPGTEAAQAGTAPPGTAQPQAGGPDVGGPGVGGPAVGGPGSSENGTSEPGIIKVGGEPGAADGESGLRDDDTQVLVPPKRPGRLARLGAGLGTGLAVAARPGRRGLAALARRRPADDDAEDVAASTLARLTSLPALLLMAWLLPGLPLLLAREFVPVPVLLISAPLAVGLVANGLRAVPSRWPRLIGGQARDRGWLSWLGLMGTVAVAAGFAAWQLVEHSEAVIVLRSQGAYLQSGYWLAQHGSLSVPHSLAAFGGRHAGLNFSSTGFFAHAATVVPQGTSGLPMLLAGGFWAHGVTGASALGAILGGFAVLSFGGLVARLAGPQWAPAGALVLGLTLPEQYIARSTFAETALQVLLFGGLCLLIDALSLRPDSPGLPPRRSRWRGTSGLTARWLTARWLTARWLTAPWLTAQRSMAGLSGLALGLGLLVSLDSVIYLLPVIPFAGLLIAARRAGGIAFLIGGVIGLSYGLADGYVLSRPFLDAEAHQLELIGVIAAWLAALTVAGVQLFRLPETRRWAARQAARRPARWLPGLASLIAVAALVGLLVRPYLQTVRSPSGVVNFRFIAALQQAQRLPVDPTRSYAEDSLYWVIWYIGLPALLLAVFGLAVLSRRCVRALLAWRDPGPSRNWALPLAIAGAGSAAVLWDPNILPDQPWASRRLVVVVLPGLIATAIWASARLSGHARERGATPVTAAVAGLFCVGAMALPTAATTLGATLSHSGNSGGLHLSAPGLAFRATGTGQIAAVAQLCAAIPPNASVVIVDPTVAQEFTQVIRGMCGVPAAWMTGRPPAAVARVLDGIAGAGRHPVLLGSRRGEVTGFGGRPGRVLDLPTTIDPEQLSSPPVTPLRVRYVIWMATPQPAAVGT
jgi:hypothetical protein